MRCAAGSPGGTASCFVLGRDAIRPVVGPIKLEVAKQVGSKSKKCMPETKMISKPNSRHGTNSSGGGGGGGGIRHKQRELVDYESCCCCCVLLVLTYMIPLLRVYT